jgi:uroporphyrinogen-III synthase
MASAIRAVGLDVLLEPVLERHVLSDAAEEIGRLGPEDWLVLTSVYAIEAVALEPARRPRVALVGEPSRHAAEARGLRVELVAAEGTGRSLFDELRTLAHSGRVCYPRSSLAALPEPWPDVELTSPVIYETVPRAFDHAVIEQVDVVCVASPSAVRAVGAVDLPFASIGPVTSAAIRELGKEPWVEAAESSFTALAQAIRGRAGGSAP